MKAKGNSDPAIDPSTLEIISIKEKVEAANYAIKIKGEEDDEDVSDIVGEVYGG